MISSAEELLKEVLLLLLLASDFCGEELRIFISASVPSDLLSLLLLELLSEAYDLEKNQDAPCPLLESHALQSRHLGRSSSVPPVWGNQGPEAVPDN